MHLKQKAKADEKLASEGFCPRESSSLSRVINTSFSSPSLRRWLQLPQPTVPTSPRPTAGSAAGRVIFLRLVAPQPCVTSPTVASHRLKPWVSLTTAACLGRGGAKVSSGHTANRGCLPAPQGNAVSTDGQGDCRARTFCWECTWKSASSQPHSAPCSHGMPGAHQAGCFLPLIHLFAAL